MVGKLSSASYAPPASGAIAITAGSDGAIQYLLFRNLIHNRRHNTGGSQGHKNHGTAKQPMARQTHEVGE
jgi:hypothetical protein